MSDNTIQVLARIFFQASNYGFHCDARIAAVRRVDDLGQVLGLALKLRAWAVFYKELP